MHISKTLCTFATSNIKRNNMTSYEKSNSILEVALKRFSSSYSHDFLSSDTSIKDREKNAQKLVDYLCDRFKIPHCYVIISNKRQNHVTRNGKLIKKVYGRYMINLNTIEIFNLTAMTKKPVAIKTMYDTLLHEFMHHYDYTKLKLSESLHTKGFAMRISDLKKKLN